MTTKQRLAITFDDEDWALLADLADLEKLPKSEIMRRALRVYRDSDKRVLGGPVRPPNQEHVPAA